MSAIATNTTVLILVILVASRRARIICRASNIAVWVRVDTATSRVLGRLDLQVPGTPVLDSIRRGLGFERELVGRGRVEELLVIGVRVEIRGGEVVDAGDAGRVACAGFGGVEFVHDGQGEVVPIHQTDVVKDLRVGAVHCEFCERGGWIAGLSAAFGAAFACQAVSDVVVSIGECAVCAAPDTALPVVGDLEGMILATFQLEPGGTTITVLLRDARPDCVGALIGNDDF